MTYTAQLIIIAAVYFLAGKLGLSHAFINPSATAIWPPTGVALATLLIWGPRAWPGIFVGAFFVNVTTTGSIPPSLGVATGNMLEALVGAFLLNRLANGTSAFDRPTDIFKFALLAGLVSTTISATVGVSSLAFAGHVRWADYGNTWVTWWLGNAGGALIVTPVLVLWRLNPTI